MSPKPIVSPVEAIPNFPTDPARSPTVVPTDLALLKQPDPRLTP